MSSNFTPTNIRAELHPIATNINTSAVIRKPMLNQPLYLVSRGSVGQFQPVSQSNFVQVKSIAQGNGIPAQTRLFSPTTISTVAVPSVKESPLVKFIKQLMELSQKNTPVGTQSDIIKLVQQLIDEKIECDAFSTQLCAILKSGHKTVDLESLLKNHIVQLRRDLASGVCRIPQITPPPLPPPLSSSTTVLVNPSNSIASTSQILPRPQDGTPASANFQIMQAGTVTLAPAFTRAPAPLVQNSIFPSRPFAPVIAPTTVQIKPSQPLPIRMKASLSPATFQQSPSSTTIAPQRGPLLSSTSVVRPIYPSTVAAVSPATVSTVTTTPLVLANVSPQNQMNQPFFPVSKIRSYLASTLPPSSTAMLSDDSLNCLAHGLDAFLRNILTSVSVIVGHKAVKLSEDPHLMQVDFARDQINYLQRLSDHDKEKQSEKEKEFILKAAKSRTRNENPDQAKFREMANQLKNEQYERERQQQANRTALNAIGLPANRRSRVSDFSGADNVLPGSLNPTSSTATAPVTRLSLVNSASHLRFVQQPSSEGMSSSISSVSGSVQSQPRRCLPASLRIRRARLRDLQVVLAKHPRLCRSRTFFLSHWR